MSLHIRAVSPQPLLFALKKSDIAEGSGPTFVPSKVVVLLLLVHFLMFLPLDCGGSVFGPCFVMHL